MQKVNAAPNIDEKASRLRELIASRPGLIVAYSGGVDSAFLAWTAREVLGERMLAVIADSASLARTHLEDALAFAREQHIPVEVVETRELENPAYARNDAMRCFHCKDELFTVLERFREERGFTVVAYGLNADDEGDFRPGQQAAKAHHVLAPLLEARLTKMEIRELARQSGLRVWEKPASACLSSRMEYGRAVTPEALNVIERGEDALRGLGFRQFRVRHHGEIVRIEIARDELSRALTEEMAREFTAIFKGLGFKFVTLDLEGFRSGSMNQLLSAEELRKGAARTVTIL
ncbi:MAG TPA: ATP-dependent sacrificial sulfur transferase LarE [Terriglobales bacterium]|nr:ATP-dependent sacrificial sulfur transferase LarE [Terriglobales bacterium]